MRQKRSLRPLALVLAATLGCSAAPTPLLADNTDSVQGMAQTELSGQGQVTDFSSGELLVRLHDEERIEQAHVVSQCDDLLYTHQHRNMQVLLLKIYLFLLL